jgi:glucoamylase
LFTGKPTGSACPLVWAHSEYIKLRRSLRDGKVFDQPPAAVQRYIVEKKKSTCFAWRFNNRCRTMPEGKKLRVVLTAPAMVHYGFNGWQTPADITTRETGLGTFVADLATDRLPVGCSIDFTFYWLQERRWEGTDFSVEVENS